MGMRRPRSVVALVIFGAPLLLTGVSTSTSSATAAATSSDAPARSSATASATSSGSTAATTSVTRRLAERMTFDTLRGGPGDDELRGGPGSDLIDGLGGDDRLFGEDGDDLLLGQDGADLLDGGAGDDDLSGGIGNDVLQGGDGADVLQGSDGDDQLSGGPGADWLFGEAGDDVLRGGPGDDVLEGGEGRDHMEGGSGNDIMEGGDGDDVMRGGAGDDTMDGGDGDNILYGGDGNDYLTGRDDGNHILIGGDGDDTLIGAQGTDQLNGGAGNDLLFGGDQADVLQGGPGDDVIGGGDGADILIGGAGNDLLSGGQGDDVLRGGPGADTLLGSGGSDQLLGGPGPDLLVGGGGEDVLEGGTGADRLIGGLGTDVVRGGPGSDVVLVRRGDVCGSGAYACPTAGAFELVDGGRGGDMSEDEMSETVDTLVLNGFSPSDFAEWPIAMQWVDSLPAENPGMSVVDPQTGGRYQFVRFERVVFSHFFPRLSTDNGPPLLRLVNPSASEASAGTVLLYTESGAPLLPETGGDSLSVTIPFVVPPLGLVELTPDASDPTLRSARVMADRPLAGVVETGFGALPRRGLGESPLVNSFLVPVELDRASGTTAGFVVSNFDVESALQVTLRDVNGDEVEVTELDLPVNGHLVLMADELFPRIDRFRGILVVAGGGPLSAVGLRASRNAGTFVTVPIVPLQNSQGQLMRVAPGAGPAEPLHFPHIVAGELGTSSIILINTATDSASATLRFFDDDGAELSIDLIGLGPTSELELDLEGGASMTVVRTGGDVGPVIGAARIDVDHGIVARLEMTRPEIGALILAPSPLMEAFIAPVARDVAQGITTEVSVHNPGPATEILWVLREANGVPTPGGSAVSNIPENGRMGASIEELFPDADTDDFRGTLTAEVSEGAVAAVVFQVSDDPAGTLVLPVTPIY